MSLFLILFILAAGAGVAFAQENATDDFCVGDKNTDEVQTQSNDVVLTQEGSFDDIKTKIEDAEVGSTVSIEGTYKCSGYYIDIIKPLTLDGNNRTILDCNHVYGALSLQSDNITIKNLKIVNSNFTAISIGANNILIENCEFINNYPIYYGSGGAISSISIMDTNNITVKNSIFTQNSNAVQIMGRDIFIINSTFIDNTEYAMSLFGLNQYVDNCRFINNSEGLYYGGISLYSNVDFESDGSEKFIVKNSIFSNNTQNAIKYVISSEINPDSIVNEAFIDNCSFTNNSADVYGSGGAIYFSSSNNYGIHSKLTVSNSRFENNRAVNNGGAINAISRDSKIINCNFTNCNVKENGGALALYGDNFTVENSRFTNNKAYFDEIYYSDIGGGAIFYSGLDLKVSGSVFENSLASKGGAILAELYEYSTGKYGLLSIEKSTFTQNHANCRFHIL